MSINNLDINPSIKQQLIKARITEVSSLFSLTIYELEEKISLNESNLKELLSVAANYLLKSSIKTAYSIHTNEEYKHHKLSTGCELVDQCLHGGIIFPGVTEICGESASGKTQLCLQICLNALISDSYSSVLYICTEDAFPMKRLQQMSEIIIKKIPFAAPTILTDRIFIEHTAELDDLWTLLNIKVDLLLSNQKIKLIVLDSVAALFRAEYDASNMINRSQMLAKFGLKLHHISHKYKICFVVVNQVSDDFNSLKSVDAFGSKKVVPALGLTWSYMVSTRILLSRTDLTCTMFQNNQAGKEQKSCDSVVRSLKVLHAPHLPQVICHFIVDEEGVKDFKLPDN
ncbi:DNA repair protein XRCC3 isoform X2 [Hydra vulgaris]|uniref:DNA repair protein XRCC3 isoform X2 n=1 Tax=Hydra vulgaris TaxID=6087 RepID=A0ABM4CG11_HYDVU